MYGTPAETRSLTDGEHADVERVHERYVEFSCEYEAVNRFEEAPLREV